MTGRVTGVVDERVGGGPVYRAVAAELAAAAAREPGHRPVVLDVGGGSGSWAVPLALLGAAVTVVDHSPDALAALQRRAREAGVAELVTAVQGDVDALAEVAPAGGADLVLGHELLEVVDDAAGAVAAMAGATRPGGAVSVLVAGRLSAVLARTVAGRLTEARAILTDPEGRIGPHDPVRRRLDAGPLQALLEADGTLVVERLQGDSVLDAWVPGAIRDDGPASAVQVAELETLGAAEPGLLAVAARLHAIARRT